jgi:DNA-binding TFAR19-related protein (PDSD5 family)
MIIIQNAQSGRFQGKVTESQLIDLMNQMSEID